LLPHFGRRRSKIEDENEHEHEDDWKREQPGKRRFGRSLYLPPDFGRRRSKVEGENEHENEHDWEQDRVLDKGSGIFPFTRRVI
jgi:hypothetical protein